MNIKAFEFSFKYNGTEWQYDNFRRMTDRPIPQQKEEIADLLSHGFDKMLVKHMCEHFDKTKDMAVVHFELKEETNLQRTRFNMQEIKSVRIGHYSFRLG